MLAVYDECANSARCVAENVKMVDVGPETSHRHVEGVEAAAPTFTGEVSGQTSTISS